MMQDDKIGEEELLAVLAKRIGEGNKRVFEDVDSIEKLPDEQVLKVITGWPGYKANVRTARALDRTANGVKTMAQMPQTAA